MWKSLRKTISSDQRHDPAARRGAPQRGDVRASGPIKSPPMEIIGKCLTADEFVEYVATATIHTSEAAQDSARALAELPDHWRRTVKPRTNSADEALLAHLLDTPILNADTAQQITGTTDVNAYRALNRLTDAGILEVLSESKRNRIWAATDVFAELDALSAAIGKRTTDHL